MKSSPKTVRALIAAFATLGAVLTSTHAQSVTTKPVGAVTKTIPVGLTSVGISLINPDLVVASCTANTASVVTLSGVASVGDLLTSGQSYYIEAISGDLEGDRFEVDVANTVLADNSTVVLNTASANNTLVLAASNAVGSQFALRKHVTLAQVQSFFTTPLVGSNTAGLADQIWLLNSTGTSFSAYFLRGDGVNWRLTGSPTNVPNTPIPPGVGIIIRKVNAPATLAVTGGVRTNDFAMPMKTGLSFQAPGYPINYSLASLGGTAANGWFGSNTASSADQVRILNSAGTSFSSYFLRADGTNWRLTGSPTNIQNSELITFDSAFIVSRQNPDLDYFLLAPAGL